MGPPSPQVRLENARQQDLAAVEAPALADTGALHLRIPAHVALQLALNELDRREVTLAGGSRRRVPSVGPILVSVANRRGVAGAMVLGTEVLPDAIPMEDMDLVVEPSTREVVPGPPIRTSPSRSPRAGGSCPARSALAERGHATARVD